MTKTFDDIKGQLKCQFFEEGSTAEDYEEIAYNLHLAVEAAMQELCHEQAIKDYTGWC